MTGLRWRSRPGPLSRPARPLLPIRTDPCDLPAFGADSVEQRYQLVNALTSTTLAATPPQTTCGGTLVSLLSSAFHFSCGFGVDMRQDGFNFLIGQLLAGHFQSLVLFHHFPRRRV